jgi:hypothetical protein
MGGVEADDVFDGAAGADLIERSMSTWMRPER